MGVMVSIRQKSEILVDEWNASRISYGIAENPLSRYFAFEDIGIRSVNFVSDIEYDVYTLPVDQGIPWNDSRMEVHVDEFGEVAWSLDPVDGFQKLYIFRWGR